MELQVDVTIVNWNSGGQLAQCLASLAASSAIERVKNVIIVDNGSTDDSLTQAEAAGLPLTVLRNAENRGFAAACNQGAAAGSAELILFLNPDTRLEPDSLARSIAHAEAAAEQDVAVFGARMVDTGGKTWRSSARFPTPARMMAAVLGLDRLLPGKAPGFFMTDWNHLGNLDVDHVIGAYYLIRREAFCAVQGFDERFFVYFEDLDLSFRIRQRGWRIRYLGDVVLEHVGGGSSAKIPITRLFYSLRSRTLYSLKHYSLAAALPIILASLSIEPLLRIAHALAGGKPGLAIAAFVAHLRLLGDLLCRGLGRA